MNYCACPRNEQVLLIDSKLQRCMQVRHYDDQMFRNAGGWKGRGISAITSILEGGPPIQYLH